jgi:uncharacterized membrane protein
MAETIVREWPVATRRGRRAARWNSAKTAGPADIDRMPVPPAADAVTADDQLVDKGRLTSFSDNVLSIAMTLLVLDVRVPPDLGHLTLLGTARLLAPRLLSFTLSFVIVGVYWVGHHMMLQGVRSAPRSVLWTNNLFLLTVSLIPASAALLGGYPGQAVSAALYGANVAVVSGSLVLLWHGIVRHHRRAGLPLGATAVRHGYIRPASGAAIALAGIPLALVSPWASYAVYWVSPAAFVVLQLLPEPGTVQAGRSGDR